jgi:hypothetical protein
VTDSGDTTPSRSVPTPKGLFQQIAELRARVDALTEALEASGPDAAAQHLRCSRLAVVGPDGTERISLEPSASSATIRVLAASGEGRSTAAELFAVDATEGDPATVGVALTREGDVVALVELGADGRARWWHADADTGTPGPPDWEA